MTNNWGIMPRARSNHHGRAGGDPYLKSPASARISWRSARTPSTTLATPRISRPCGRAGSRSNPSRRSEGGKKKVAQSHLAGLWPFNRAEPAPAGAADLKDLVRGAATRPGCSRRRCSHPAGSHRCRPCPPARVCRRCPALSSRARCGCCRKPCARGARIPAGWAGAR
jgi:hypothetical protein